MITLLIIADDFTGALDTGVQFAASGANTRVVTHADYDFKSIDEAVQVLVMDAETRHMRAEDAYEVVYDMTLRAIEAKIPYLYKKTDSALRGNIGSELTAILQASNEKSLYFLPAFPKMNRQTKEGYHFIDDVLVSESVFGKDPFEPVTSSYIPEMIERQSNVKVKVKSLERFVINDKEKNDSNQSEKVLYILDAQTDDQLKEWGDYLKRTNKMHLTAGCAGFATVLPDLLSIKGEDKTNIKLLPNFLMLCGSVNPITSAQLDYAENNGFLRVRLKPEERLNQTFWTSDHGQARLKEIKDLSDKHACMILDSNDLLGQEETKEYAEFHNLILDDIRVRIAASFGYILKYLFDQGLESTLMITGGDTLLGCMEELSVKEMEPICELAPGTVLAQFGVKEKKYQVITKSGGFGPETLLVDLADSILKNKRQSLKNDSLKFRRTTL